MIRSCTSFREIRCFAEAKALPHVVGDGLGEEIAIAIDLQQVILAWMLQELAPVERGIHQRESIRQCPSSFTSIARYWAPFRQVHSALMRSGAIWQRQSGAA